MPRVNRGNSRGGLTTLFCTYRIGAKKRGYTFDLTREEFAVLTKQDCWYCGVEPAQIRRNGGGKLPTLSFYLYNGIDRVDNSVGYTLANCIPCCGACNRMKNVQSGEDFVSRVRKIARNLGML